MLHQLATRDAEGVGSVADMVVAHTVAASTVHRMGYAVGALHRFHVARAVLDGHREEVPANAGMCNVQRVRHAGYSCCDGEGVFS